MPFSRHFLPELNFVLTRTWGMLSDDDVLSHVRALNTSYGDQESLVELGDARGLKASGLMGVTFSSVIRAAQLEEGQKRVADGRLAIVADDLLIFGFARAYTTVSSHFRGDAGAFRDLQEAMTWLGLAEHQERILHFMEEARIVDENKENGHA